MRKKASHPWEWPSNCWSQSSVLANQQWTTRTTHHPPERASTVHSVATLPGPSSVSTLKLWGGFHVLMVPTESMPGPKLLTALPPSRSSLRVGTNQDEIPG